jgi:hypothetical protein
VADLSILLSKLLACSTPGRLRHLVQLHLSRECNRPRLAALAGKAALRDGGSAARVFTARQDEASGVFRMEGGRVQV